MAKTREETINARFKSAKTKRQEKDPVWKELDAFDRNQQWDLESLPSWLPKPVTNFIHLVKYTKRAALAIDNPTGKLRAVSPNGVGQVDKLNKGFQYAWERIKARKVVRQNIETSKLLGTAIAHVYWDEAKEGTMGTTILGDEGYQFEGEIGIKELDPSAVYPDPSAFTIEDCRYIHVVERKPLEWVKKNAQLKALASKGMKDVEEGENTPEDRGEIYLRDYVTENKGMVDFHSHYEKEPNEEGGFTYYVSYLVGDQLIVDKHPLRPNRYPFAILYDFPQRHDFWAMSTCQFILDNQRIINKVESIIAMIGTLMQNPQKVVSKQSGIDPSTVSTYGNLPGFTVEANGDPTRAIHYVNPPNIPPVLFSLLENAKQNIREITGMNEAYMGGSVGSLQTSTGVQSLIERATMRDNDQMYDIELYIEDLSRLIIDFMVEYYEEPRMIRVMGESPDDYSFEPFLGSIYRGLEYDIFIDVSSKAPITRLNESQTAEKLLTLQGQYGGVFGTAIIKPQEAIKMMNIPKSDEIIKRMDIEEMRNKTDEAMQVANMMAESISSGVPPEEVQQMAMTMFQQLEEQADSMGSTSNNFQNQQGSPVI
jgi:hypothetical protein